MVCEIINLEFLTDFVVMTPCFQWLGHSCIISSDGCGGFTAPNNPPFSWEARMKVAVGVAKGLHYLHEQCQRRIIHRDIKASNILLDTDFNPQVGADNSRLLNTVWKASALHASVLRFYVSNMVHYSCGIQISDFGLSKWLPERWMHHTVAPIEGTFGYANILLNLIVNSVSEERNACGWYPSAFI